MATDWAADVKKYVANADDAAIAGIVRYCGIALTKRDSSLVSFTDSKETDRVRNNYLKKKLALTDPDSVLDAAIAKVGEIMKADRTKNRVTVYYLLADHFGKLGLFIKGGAAAPAKAAKKAPAKKAPAKKAPAKAKTGGAVAAAGGAAMGLASMGSGAKAAANDAGAGATAALGAAGAAVAGAATAAAAGAADMAGKAVDAVGDAAAGAAGMAAAGADKVTGAASALLGGESDEQDGGWNWLLWLLLGLLALWLLWWLLFGRNNMPSDVESVDLAPASEAAASASGSGSVDLAAAPAEGSVAIPAGAGVTSEMRDGKPVVKVYFDTGKTDVVPDFTATAGGLKAWLDAHPGATLAISGYNDPSGNAAANAELSKNRAQAVQAALVAAGIPEASAELVKPEATTDTTTNAAAARRVEVVVR